MVCKEEFVVCKGQPVQKYYGLYGKSVWFGVPTCSRVCKGQCLWFVRGSVYKSIMICMGGVCGL